MKRNFTAGEHGVAGGFRYRIVEGKKTPRGPGQDLRLDIGDGNSWTPVGMPLVFLLIDFLCENEDVLFPPPRYEGGGRLLRYVNSVYPHSTWQAATDLLQDERDRAEERRKAA